MLGNITTPYFRWINCNFCKETISWRKSCHYSKLSI